MEEILGFLYLLALATPSTSTMPNGLFGLYSNVYALLNSSCFSKNVEGFSPLTFKNKLL